MSNFGQGMQDFHFKTFFFFKRENQTHKVRAEAILNTVQHT